jgi:hypothetical protein
VPDMPPLPQSLYILFLLTKEKRESSSLWYYSTSSCCCLSEDFFFIFPRNKSSYQISNIQRTKRDLLKKDLVNL